MENFIHVWGERLPHEICDEIIDCFETNFKNNPNNFQNDGLLFNRLNMSRKDLSIDLKAFKRPHLIDSVNHHIFNCLEQYKQYYGQLAYINYTTNNQFKVQRTLPLGGYHEWHFENAPYSDMCLREIVWTIYLNDMPPFEAETEFLYQAVKVRPEKGSICLFPAAMTHVHRGLTVYSHPKYIVTGWFSKILKDSDLINHQEQLEFNFEGNNL